MKVSDIQGSHPLVLHGTKPPFDFGLGGRGIRSAVVQSGTYPCGKQFHLSVLIGPAVIDVKKLRPSVLGHGRFHDRHEVYKVIVVKDINTGNETAGIINKSDDVELMLFAIRCFEVRPDRTVASPDFIDMGPFIAAHILVVRGLPFQCQLVYVAVDGGF